MSLFFNEFEPFAAAWLRQLMADGRLPHGVVDARSIADISGAEVSEYRRCHWFAGIGGWELALQLAGWPRDRSVWTGSCPCFPAGTLVLTADGYKPIEAVVVGDMVLTHRARFRRVQAVGSDVSECVLVKGQGHYGLTCTPEHPFLVGDELWCEAKDLTGKRWATVAQVPALPVPMPKSASRGVFFDKHAKGFRVKGDKAGRPVYVGLFKNETEAEQARESAIREGKIDVRGADAVDVMSVGFAKFLGYWIGDGWFSGDGVFLCGAREDLGLLGSLFADAKLPGKPYLQKTSSRIRCGSKGLSTWLRENFGEYAHGKRIPAWLYGMPQEYRQAFLDGYLLADGHEETQRIGGGRIKAFTTASRALAVGVRVLLNQMGKSASISRTQNNRVAVIDGRTISESPSYRVIAYETARSFRLLGQHGWGLVRSVEPAGTHAVYNLAVEEDESYTADGIVVHNCQDFSSAGKRKGIGADRDLWPTFARLIRECRPKCVFGEQVSAAIRFGWLDRLQADMEAEGYTVGACVLGAHSSGAGHQRQRLYWVAHTGQVERGRRPGEQRPDRDRAAERCEEATDHQRRGAVGPVADADGAETGSGELRLHAIGGSGDGLAGVKERTVARGVEHPASNGRGEGRAESDGRGFVSGCLAVWDHWRDAVTIECRDGKRRRVPVEPALFPLAHGISNRVGLLRGAGNAICVQTAALFVRAFLEAEAEREAEGSAARAA